MTAEADVQRGLEAAYRALAQKERTAAEIRALLEARELAPEAVETVMAELEQTGAIDDSRFARLFAEDKRSLAAWGDERIREALRGRGIERGVIEAALVEEDGGAQLERAVALLRERRFDPTLERDRARALGLLARRGYESELAYDAIRRLEDG